MRKKLLWTYMFVIAVTIIITILFSWNKVNNHFLNQAENESIIQLKLLNKILEIEGANSTYDFQKFAVEYGDTTHMRITIIDNEGVVLGDSLNDPSSMENHKYRPEFKKALIGETESSMRYSSTMGSYLYYYALGIEMDDFQGAIRVSLPIDDIQALVWDLIKSIIFSLIIGVALSAAIAYVFARRFMEPIDELTLTAKLIADGAYDNKVYIDNEDQIGELAKAFNTMTFNMRKSLWEIEQKNAELESILVSIDSGLVAVDENYRIILCNEPFQKIFGLKEDHVGKLFYEVTRDTHIFNVIEKSIEEDEFLTEETRLGKYPKEMLVKISATPIKNRMTNMDTLGVLVLVEDITNLRKLENIRSEFVSNVSHELKTPLTSIKGFVETLRLGAIHDEKVAARFLDIIDIETERLTRLIGDILSLSEIENLPMDNNSGINNIGEIIHEVYEILIDKADKRNITLELQIQADLNAFPCNRDRIKQLMINLIDNSINYTESGIVTVIARESKDKENLILEVKDTGIGIEQEHLERLFERFYRVDKGRSRKLGGTGLGLSIVKHIVELYQGTIKVKSQVGVGTDIKISMPYKK